MEQDFFIIDKDSINLLSENIDDYPNGIVIPIDKPYKWTSADVVRKIKFISQKHFKKKNIKVGHAGTLDPLATGVLLVCIGKATKQAEALQSEAKEYLSQIELGATTPCFDLEKEIDNTYPYSHISLEMINTILPTFLGEQEQVPPIFSAKLIDGKRAYEIARAGENVEMKPSKIIIYNLEIVNLDLPQVVIKIKCSKGTYIRSFARDFGVALQSGAYLSGLVRLSSGKFNVSKALKIEDIEKIFKK